MKKIFYILIIFFIVIVIDSLIAFSFDKSPIFRYRVYYNDTDIKQVDKGLFVDCYYCVDGKVDTVIKGSGYSCSSNLDKENDEVIKNYKEVLRIVDESTPDDMFGQMLEDFYEDDEYIYSFPDTRSSVIIVYYVDGSKENVKEALKNGHINISELDKFNIKYYKTEKN